LDNGTVRSQINDFYGNFLAKQTILRDGQWHKVDVPSQNAQALVDNPPFTMDSSGLLSTGWWLNQAEYGVTVEGSMEAKKSGKSTYHVKNLNTNCVWCDRIYGESLAKLIQDKENIGITIVEGTWTHTGQALGHTVFNVNISFTDKIASATFYGQSK
jgi:hypothetical protein